MVRRSIFDKIFREMQQIHFRLDDLERSLSRLNTPATLEMSEAKLISLSDHLRKTYMTVASVGECDANRVSNLTRRCRALESNYLNQLCRMGWLNKNKVSKKTLFRLAADMKASKRLAGQPVVSPNISLSPLETNFRKYFSE